MGGRLRLDLFRSFDAVFSVGQVVGSKCTRRGCLDKFGGIAEETDSDDEEYTVGAFGS